MSVLVGESVLGLEPTRCVCVCVCRPVRAKAAGVRGVAVRVLPTPSAAPDGVIIDNHSIHVTRPGSPATGGSPVVTVCVII